MLIINYALFPKKLDLCSNYVRYLVFQDMVFEFWNSIYNDLVIMNAINEILSR